MPVKSRLLLVARWSRICARCMAVASHRLASKRRRSGVVPWASERHRGKLISSSSCQALPGLGQRFHSPSGEVTMITRCLARAITTIHHRHAPEANSAKREVSRARKQWTGSARSLKLRSPRLSSFTEFPSALPAGYQLARAVARRCRP